MKKIIALALAATMLATPSLAEPSARRNEEKAYWAEMEKTRAKLETQKDAEFLTSVDDAGGYIDVYYARTEFYAEHGILIRIQGMCMSACTMYTGLEKVCLMPGSYLMLHQGSTVEATDDMMANMNPFIAEYVQEKLWPLPKYVANAPDEDDHKNFTRMDADFIIKNGWMKECENKTPKSTS